MGIDTYIRDGDGGKEKRDGHLEWGLLLLYIFIE